MVKSKVVDKSIKININLADLKDKKKQTRRKRVSKKSTLTKTKPLPSSLTYPLPSGAERPPYSFYIPGATQQPIQQTPPTNIVVPQPPTDTSSIISLLEKFNRLEFKQNKLLEDKSNNNDRLISEETLDENGKQKKKYNNDYVINKPESKITERIEKATMPDLGKNWIEYNTKLPIVYKSDIVELNDEEKSNNALNDLVTHQKKTEELKIDIGANEFNDEREIERQVENNEK
jgi:hypothetical protein